MIECCASSAENYWGRERLGTSVLATSLDPRDTQACDFRLFRDDCGGGYQDSVVNI